MGLRAKTVTALGAVLAVTGCVQYHKVPLKPEVFETAYRARNLRDADVLAFAEHHAAASQPASTEPARGDAWTLEQLARAAIYFNPMLKVAQAHVGTVRAGEETAGESPNPSVSAAPSWASNAGNLNPWIVAFTFDVPIETAGKRKDRVAQAKALTQAAKYDLADMTWKTRSHVRDAIVELLVNEQAATLYAQEVEHRNHYVKLLQARLEAGEAGRAEVNVARVDLITARQAWRAAEGLLADSRTRLAAAIGVPTSGLAGVDISWEGFENPPVLDADATLRLQEAGLLNRLDVRRTLAEYDAAESALKLEVAKQYPDLHLGPGYTFNQGQHEWQLGASLTLPILNQNGGAISEAAGRRTEQAGRFQSLQAQVIGEVESAQVRYESALRELAEANAQVTTLNDEVNAGNEQLKAGEADRLTLVGLEIQKDVAERLRQEAIRKAQESRGALEDAVERPLPATSPTTLPAAPSASTQKEDALK